jgi:hypothetical protein
MVGPATMVVYGREWERSRDFLMARIADGDLWPGLRFQF